MFHIIKYKFVETVIGDCAIKLQFVIIINFLALKDPDAAKVFAEYTFRILDQVRSRHIKSINGKTFYLRLQIYAEPIDV